MAQPEKVLSLPDSGSKVFGISKWAVMGAVVFIGILCMTIAMADDAVFLRTLMPVEESESLAPQEYADTADETDADEQRLIDLLYQDDQNAVFQTVENDERWRVVRMRVTAYCPCSKCCGKYSDGITACNHRIQPGDVFAAADKAYRFGTDLIVPGYNNNQPIEVLDRGRLIKGNRLDVFFSSHSVAKKWGTRYLDVMVREK